MTERPFLLRVLQAEAAKNMSQKLLADLELKDRDWIQVDGVRLGSGSKVWQTTALRSKTLKSSNSILFTEAP